MRRWGSTSGRKPCRKSPSASVRSWSPTATWAMSRGGPSKSDMRSFAIVPAAGHSARMGQPKLLLPLAGRPLILHTVSAWLTSRVDAVLIVIRTDDTALASAIEELADSRISLVQPHTSPPDMKASVQAALRRIEQDYAPAADDPFLLAPADMPALSPRIIDLLIETYATQPNRILTPT